MLWFFQRGNEYLRIETTRNRETGAFALTLYTTEGPEQTEVFADQGAFEARLEALEQQLTAEQWTATGSSLLPKQPDPRPH